MTNIFLVSIRVKDFMYDKAEAKVKADKDIVRMRGNITQNDRGVGLLPVICQREKKEEIDRWDEVKLIGWKEYGTEEEIPKEWTTRNAVRTEK